MKVKFQHLQSLVDFVLMLFYIWHKAAYPFLNNHTQFIA